MFWIWCQEYILSFVGDQEQCCHWVRPRWEDYNTNGRLPSLRRGQPGLCYAEGLLCGAQKEGAHSPQGMQNRVTDILLSWLLSCHNNIYLVKNLTMLMTSYMQCRTPPPFKLPCNEGRHHPFTLKTKINYNVIASLFLVNCFSLGHNYCFSASHLCKTSTINETI